MGSPRRQTLEEARAEAQRLRAANTTVNLVRQQTNNAVDTQIALNQPVETYGEAARTRAVEAAGRAPTLRDVQDLAPPPMTWTQMLERAQAASMKAQLENDRRQEAFARRIASGEASPRPGEPSWETAVRAAPPPSVLPDEVMRAIGPMGISGVQLQNTRSGDTVGQLAPDQHVDTSRLDSPWTKKLAPLALGSGSKVQQGLTQVARGAYDPAAPEGQRWVQGVPEKSQAVLGPNDYAEAVAGRSAEGGGVKSMAALIAEETTSKALAQAAKLAQAWNNLQWISEAAGGIPVPNNPDQQEAKQWGEVARQLESGVMGETAGAQIPQEAKDEIAVDAAKVFGRTAGTAAEMKIPTEAIAVAPAMRAAGRPVAAAARGVHNALMDSSLFGPGYQRMARLVSDAPSVAGLPPELAAKFRMARNAEQAEPLLRQMETAKSIDEALSSSAWWSDVPAADRWRILLRTGTPESEAGKRGMAILSEAAQFEHSAMAQQAASREAQEALAAMAPIKVNVQRTAGMDVPQPFHPLWGQDFTKSAGRIATVINEDAQLTGQRAGDVLESPYGKALTESGDMATYDKSARAAKELEAAEDAWRKNNPGVQDADMDALRSLRDAMVRRRAGAATDSDFATELADKMRQTYAGAGRLAGMTQREGGKARVAVDDVVRKASDTMDRMSAGSARAAGESGAQSFLAQQEMKAAASAAQQAAQSSAREIGESVRHSTPDLLESRLVDHENKLMSSLGVPSSQRDRVRSLARQYMASGEAAARGGGPHTDAWFASRVASGSRRFLADARKILSEHAANTSTTSDALSAVDDASAGASSALRSAADKRLVRMRDLAGRNASSQAESASSASDAMRTKQWKFMEGQKTADDTLDAFESRMRDMEDAQMRLMGVPSAQRDRVRALARQAAASDPSRVWGSESARSLFADTASQAERVRSGGGGIGIEGVGDLEGERLANTEAARRMLKADVEQASPRMVKRLEEELSRSNLAGNVVASARETAARPGRVAAFRYIDDAMRSGVAEDFAPAGTAVKRYNRQATDRITLSPQDIKKLQQQNKVFLQVAGESDTVTDVLGRGDYHAVIRLPDGVDPALYHGKAVPRTLARALMEQAHGPGRTQEAAEAAADFMNKLMATKQVTNAMTVGRGGFQAANISNEVMRAIADEPDLFKGETPKLLARVLTAKDGEHIAELGMNARDARRVLIQGSGAGRGFASTMASTADEQATFTTGRIAADAARAAGLKRTGKAIDAASDALDAGVNAVTAPGRAMNDVVDEAFNSAMFGHTPGFKTEDNLRMALMLHKMQRGVRPEIAAQEVQRALINFGDTNALQRMGKTLIPFVNYYTKSIEGALYLSLRNPNQYRWLNRFVQAQEQADSVANARPGRSINAKFKSPDDALSFKALIQSGKDRNGNPVVMSVGGDTVPAEGAQLARALENTAGYMTGTSTPEGSRDVLGMLNPVVAGALTAARGVDTASGRPVIPVDRKEEQRISAEARAAHPVLSAFNMPLAEAQWISEHPAENQAPLGATPNLYKMLLAAAYTPGVGRLMAQPQAAMLGRWASGAPGNNPASMTDEARSSEYTRALMKLAGVKNATSVNVLDQAYADQLRSAKDLEKAAGLRLMNEKLKGKTVWRNP